MGNLDALRDWGHAKDYVRMQWMMLQQDRAQDYVIATGQQFSVREFIHWSAEELGVTLRFVGQGVDEKGVVERVKGDKESRPEEHTSELQSLMRNSYAVFSVKRKKHYNEKIS